MGKQDDASEGQGYSPDDTSAAPEMSSGNLVVEIKIYKNCKLTVSLEDVRQPAAAFTDDLLTLKEPALKQLVLPDTATTVPSIAGGRTLPKLLFVTNKNQLAANVGQTEAADILSRIGTAGGSIIDDISEKAATDASERVRAFLQTNSSTKGVVIIGGYDVIPPQLLDCLPTDLRNSLPKDVADADSFRVWSDDVYGDVDGDGIPELPVSRIPDGRSSQLMLAALNSRPSRHNGSRFGLRNVERPAADDVFAIMAGNASMLQSEPIDLDNSPSFKLDADNAYMWLHGAFWDATTFWGQDEKSGNLLDAFTQKIPSASCANVVLAAACWGGLTVDTPAGRLQPDAPIAPVVPESSIALTFLLNGSVAFVGCTGSHYSPTGAPLHMAFWKAIQSGMGPAAALLQAKQDFIRGMPHGNQGPALLAVEYKTYTEFTCLGIGW